MFTSYAVSYYFNFYLFPFIFIKLYSVRIIIKRICCKSLRNCIVQKIQNFSMAPIKGG